MANDFLEFEGKTVENAIEAACKHFNITKEELKYEIITRGSTGLFGLGSKKAKIKVFPPEIKTTAQMEQPETGITVDSSEGAVEIQTANESQPTPQHAPVRRTDSPKTRSDRSRRSSLKAEPTDASQGVEVSSGGMVEDEKGGDVAVPEEAMDAAKQPDEATLNEALVTARQLMALCHFDCEVSLKHHEDQSFVIFEGVDIPIIIGKDGQTLEAIEYIINRILTHKMGTIVPVTCDAGTYRASRDEKLIASAKRKAEAAKKTGKSIPLAPMNPRDRRLIHLSLRGFPGIKTTSVGEGERRRVVIIPLSKSKRRARRQS